MVFPQYRKYSNGQSYFKIISETELIELKIFGNMFELHHIKAKILPERLLVEDLLYHYQNFAVAIHENEFENQLSYCMQHLKQLH